MNACSCDELRAYWACPQLRIREIKELSSVEDMDKRFSKGVELRIEVHIEMKKAMGKGNGNQPPLSNYLQ